ncbi:MAG: PQQ-binding-like beta-propeller repeat protein [Marinifilaceae bacterium]
MKKKFTTNQLNTRLWKGIALVAGAFSFIICCLLIVNYLQLNRIDPVNTEVINTLVERLNENPKDVQLREQIRELDLLARKAYFTNQWQIRTGGYLLLFLGAILVIALQMLYSRKKVLASQSNEDENRVLFFQKSARKWMTISGAALVSVALVFAFFSHKELEKQFSKAAVAAKIEPAINEAIPEEEPVEKKSQSNAEPEKNNEKTVSKDIIASSGVGTVSVGSAGEKVETPVKAEPVKVVKAKPVKKEKASQPKASIVYPTKNMKGNYPSFRGPGGNGIAYQKNIPIDWDGTSGKNILWKTPIPLHGYNSPIIWGKKVFLSGADATKREVYCFDRNSGKILWTASVNNVPDSPTKSPEVTEDTGHAAASLATDGEKVYAIFSNGDIAAINMKGKQVWARNLGVPQNHYGHSSSLVVYQDMVIVQYDHRKSAQVMALATETGETVWSTKRKVKISWASPVVVSTGSKAEVLLSSDPFIASYDANTGKELWKLDCMSGEVGPSVAYADGIVYAMNEYASLVAIKMGDKPEKLWESYDYLSDVPSPIATDKYLLVPTSYGLVACFNAKTGDVLWEQEFDVGFYASPILVDGKVYLMNKQGVMNIFKLGDKFESIANVPLGEKSMCTPAFGDGRIYIRADKNLYCIGK